MNWKPSKEDVEWTEQLLRVLKHNGVWNTFFGAFQIDQENKVLKAVYLREDRMLCENTRRVKICIEKLGWRFVVEKQDEEYKKLCDLGMLLEPGSFVAVIKD